MPSPTGIHFRAPAYLAFAEATCSSTVVPATSPDATEPPYLAPDRSNTVDVPAAASASLCTSFTKASRNLVEAPPTGLSPALFTRSANQAKASGVSIFRGFSAPEPIVT